MDLKQKILAALLLLPALVFAQVTNNSSISGISGSETAAAVTAAFSGTCDASHYLRGDGSCAVPGGGGTVTSASVVTANGFSGTIANPTTTPALTISETITGLLYGNGTALSAATQAQLLPLVGQPYNVAAYCTSGCTTSGDFTAAAYAAAAALTSYGGPGYVFFGPGRTPTFASGGVPITITVNNQGIVCSPDGGTIIPDTGGVFALIDGTASLGSGGLKHTFIVGGCQIAASDTPTSGALIEVRNNGPDTVIDANPLGGFNNLLLNGAVNVIVKRMLMDQGNNATAGSQQVVIKRSSSQGSGNIWFNELNMQGGTTYANNFVVHNVDGLHVTTCQATKVTGANFLFQPVNANDNINGMNIMGCEVGGVAFGGTGTHAFDFEPYTVTGATNGGTITAGSSYVAGTYTAVPLTGGTGTGAQATIVVNADGTIHAGGVTITTPGSSYAATDSLSASNANLGGSGSGFAYSLAYNSKEGNDQFVGDKAFYTPNELVYFNDPHVQNVVLDGWQIMDGPTNGIHCSSGVDITLSASMVHDNNNGNNAADAGANILVDGTCQMQLSDNVIKGETPGGSNFQPTYNLSIADAGIVNAQNPTFKNAVTADVHNTSSGAVRVSAGTTDQGTLPWTSLGVIAATSLNGNTFTTGTYTLTGGAGKTLTFNNSLTVAGTDATTMTFPASSATVAGLGIAETFSALQTFTGGITVSGGGAFFTNGGTVNLNNGGSSSTNIGINNNSGTTTIGNSSNTGKTVLAGLASSSAAQTGTVCIGASNILTYDTTTTCLASSKRWKMNIVPLDAGLDELMQLKPVSYDLKPAYNPAHLGRQVGLIAEDVQKVDTRLVGLGVDGKPNGVRYQQMVALLVKSIQEQQGEIVALKGEVAALKHSNEHSHH